MLTIEIGAKEGLYIQFRGWMFSIGRAAGVWRFEDDGWFFSRRFDGEADRVTEFGTVEVVWGRA